MIDQAKWVGYNRDGQPDPRIRETDVLMEYLQGCGDQELERVVSFGVYGIIDFGCDAIAYPAWRSFERSQGLSRANQWRKASARWILMQRAKPEGT